MFREDSPARQESLPSCTGTGPAHRTETRRPTCSRHLWTHCLLFHWAEGVSECAWACFEFQPGKPEVFLTKASPPGLEPGSTLLLAASCTGPLAMADSAGAFHSTRRATLSRPRAGPGF